MPCFEIIAAFYYIILAFCNNCRILYILFCFKIPLAFCQLTSAAFTQKTPFTIYYKVCPVSCNTDGKILGYGKGEVRVWTFLWGYLDVIMDRD